MKIAVVDNVPEGGAKRVVYEQVKYLSQKHEVWYGTGETSDHYPWQALPIVKRSYQLVMDEHGGWKRPLREWQLVTSLRREYLKIAHDIFKFGAQVAIVHPDRYTQAPWLLSLTACPRVYYAHEWLRLVYEPDLFSLEVSAKPKIMYEHLRRMLVRDIDKRNVSKASRVIANSRYTARHCQQAYSVDAEVVHPGVDTKRFTPDKRLNRGAYFLFIGEKDGVHGYDLFSEAIARSPVPIRTKVVSFKNGRFSYDETEIVNIYQGAVAVCCLDRHEPFGLVPLEAMACGIPPIAVNEGGYKETIIDGKTGLLVERSAEALYRAMRRLAANEAERVMMGKAGRERAVKLFSWKRHGKQLEAILEELA